MITPVGPEGDPDATDGQRKAMFGCIPVFVIAVVSAFVLPCAAGWRGKRLGRALAVIAGVVMLLMLIVLAVTIR